MWNQMLNILRCWFLRKMLFTQISKQKKHPVDVNMEFPSTILIKTFYLIAVHVCRNYGCNIFGNRRWLIANHKEQIFTNKHFDNDNAKNFIKISNSFKWRHSHASKQEIYFTISVVSKIFHQRRHASITIKLLRVENTTTSKC